jgi:transcriptional regulator with XRE-family HTH domain
MTCAKLWRTILETETLRSLEAVVATGESWGRTARLRRLEQRLTKIDLQRISGLSPTTISKIEESDTSVTQTTMRRYSLAVGWDERTLEQLRAGRRVLLGGSQDGSGLSDENIARVAEAISRVQPLRTQIVDVTDLSRSDIGLVELLVDRLRRRDP